MKRIVAWVFLVVTTLLALAPAALAGDDGVSTVSIRIDGVDVTDDVVIESASFQSIADGQYGEANIVIDDLGHAYSGDDIKTGMTLELYIDGTREWDGWVFTVKRAWPLDADDTSAPSTTPRLWKIRGYDRNLLFQKRFMYRVAQPDDDSGFKIWPTETTDKAAIEYALEHYVDLSGDGLTFDIESVASPGPYEEFTLGYVAAPLGTLFEDAAKITGAVFYISPQRVLKYVDDMTVTAPYILTDTPAGAGQVGYRDLNAVADFTHAANQALVWGAGKGSADPVFADYKDDASIADHGLWQWGDLYLGAWKQQTVNRRARTYVDGSKSHRRGHGEPNPVVTATVFEPGFQVGQVVDFRADVFNYQKDLPIRKSTITFPTKSTPRYDLELSLQVDTPFGIPDLWNYNFPPWDTDEVIPPEGPGGIGGGDPTTTGSGLIDHYDQSLGDVVFYCVGSWYGDTDQPAPMFDGLVGAWPGTYGMDNGWVTRFTVGGGRKTWMTNPEGWSEVHGVAADHTGVYASIYGGVGGYVSGGSNYDLCGVEKWSPDGVRLWKHADPDWEPPVSMHARDGLLLAAHNPVTMFDAETGDILWTYTLPEHPTSAWILSGGSAWVLAEDFCRLFDSGGAITKTVAMPYAVRYNLWHASSDPDVFYGTNEVSDGYYNLYSLDLSGDDAVLTLISVLAAPEPAFPPWWPVFSMDSATDELYGFGGKYTPPPSYSDTRWVKKWVNGVEQWHRVPYTENDYLNLSQQLSAGGMTIVAGGAWNWTPQMYVYSADGDRILSAFWADDPAEVASRQHWNINGAAIALGAGYSGLSTWVTPGTDVTGADPALQPGGNVYDYGSATTRDIADSYVWLDGWMDLYSEYYQCVGASQGEWDDPSSTTPARPWGKTPLDLLVRFKRVAGSSDEQEGLLSFEFWNNDLDPDAVAAWASEQYVAVYWDDAGESYILAYPTYKGGCGIAGSVYPDGLGHEVALDYLYYSGSAESDYARRQWDDHDWQLEVKKLIPEPEQDVEYAMRIQIGEEVVDETSNLKTFRVKVWKDADPEPAAWDIDIPMGTYRYNQDTYLGYPSEDGWYSSDGTSNDMIEINAYPSASDEKVGIQGLWLYGTPGTTGTGISPTEIPVYDNATETESGTYVTRYPYQPGSLKVYFQGILLRSGTDFTEVDPASGSFRILGGRDISSQLYVRYRRAGSVPNTTGGTVYRPAPVLQYGWGTPLDGWNCTFACGVMALDRHTLGANTPYSGTPRSTPPNQRGFQSDQVGGASIQDLAVAWANGWGETLYDPGVTSWSNFVSRIASGRGAILQGRYGDLPASKRFSNSFTGPHAIYINEVFSNGTFWGCDPLYRYPVIYTAAELQAYAEGLSFVDPGYVSAAFTRATV